MDKPIMNPVIFNTYMYVNSIRLSVCMHCSIICINFLNDMCLEKNVF